MDTPSPAFSIGGLFGTGPQGGKGELQKALLCSDALEETEAACHAAAMHALALGWFISHLRPGESDTGSYDKDKDKSPASSASTTTTTASSAVAADFCALDLQRPHEPFLPHQMDGFGQVQARFSTSWLAGDKGAARSLAAIAVVLRHIARADELILGVEDTEGMMGFEPFEAVPLRLCFEEHDPQLTLGGTEAYFNQLLSDGVSSYASHLQPLTDLCKRLGVDVLNEQAHPLFQVLVSFEDPAKRRKNSKRRSPGQHGPTCFNKVCETRVQPLALVWHICLNGSSMQVHLTYSRQQVGPSLAQAMLKQVQNLLEYSSKATDNWAAQTKEGVDSVTLATAKERKVIMEDWSVGPVMADFIEADGGDCCIHELMERSARQNPEAAAIFDGMHPEAAAANAKGKPTFLNYAAVIAWTNRLGKELMHPEPLATGELVALLFDRSIAMIVAIYAVLRAGGCYCPLDPQWPADRLNAVMTDAQAKKALCLTTLEAKLRAGAPPGLHVIAVDEAEAKQWADGSGQSAWEGGITSNAPTSRDPCYVFFTSGSTGRPKGVVVEHRGLVHRSRWLQTSYGIDSTDRIVLKHAYTFGLSEWEIFWPLSYGAAVVVPVPGGEKDMPYMADIFAYHKVANSVFVPSVLQLLLEHLESELPGKGRSSKVARSVVSRLKQVIACGEALRMPQVHHFHRLMPIAEIDNIYGPTEGEMTRYVCPRGRALRTVPIGVPIDGARTYALGTRFQPCGVLVPGEVFFAGPYIARGYLNQPTQTADRFVQDPYVRSLDDKPGMHTETPKMYRTGDLVRWCADGNLEFLGRVDHQVKINGYRIELGDIEQTVISASSGAASPIREAVAIVDTSGPAARLVVHIGVGEVLTDGAEAAITHFLKDECEKRLPKYMVPQVIMVHDALPRNTNRKVDRKALPCPPSSQSIIGDVMCDMEAVLTPTEATVRDVWAKVLGRPSASISAEANFFNTLGGSSLLAGKATSALRTTFGVELAGTAMYTHSSVARIAHLIEELVKSNADHEHVDVEDVKNAGQSDGASLVQRGLTKRLSSTRPWLITVQGSLALLLCLHEQVLVNAVLWFGIFALQETFGMCWWFVFAVPLLFALDLFVMAMTAVVVKFIVLRKLPPGNYPLWGGMYVRWWFVNQVLETTEKTLIPIFGDTVVLNWWYRLLGAKIDWSANLCNPHRLMVPDLITVGPRATICRGATIECATVCNSELKVRPVFIEAGATVGTNSYVSPGSRVKASQTTQPMSSVFADGLAPKERAKDGDAELDAEHEAKQAKFERQQGVLRAVIGVPWVLLVLGLPYVGLLFLFDHVWDALVYFNLEHAEALQALVIWPTLLSHGYSILMVSLVILQKRFVIGRLGPGAQIGLLPPSAKNVAPSTRLAHWQCFRHWLHERCVTAEAFVEALSPLVNTELLATVQRLLGAKVGRRVQTDNFKAVEHDCIEIEDYVVFGSEVSIHCGGNAAGAGMSGKLSPVKLLRGANVLDHSCLMPGAVVGEQAVLGSCTLGCAGTTFPPDSISTGAVNGEAVLLRQDASANTPPSVRELEFQAMRRVDSPLMWGFFNFTTLFVSFVFHPLPQVGWIYATMLAHKHLNSEEHPYWSLLNWLAIFIGFNFLLVFVSIAIKWTVIGRYREANFAFFSSFHFRWMTMLSLNGSMAPLMDHLHGTPFLAWYYSAMGAKVGRDVYLAGLALEFDLLSVADNASINEECDSTCHTVERMVLKMAPVTVEAGASQLGKSIVMPGGTLGEGAVLLQNSQVLKGEAVPAGEVWAGLPAKAMPIQTLNSAVPGA